MPSDVPSAALRAGSARRSSGPWRRSGSGRSTDRRIEAVCFANRGYRFQEFSGEGARPAGGVCGLAGSTGSKRAFFLAGGEADHGEATFGGEFYRQGVWVTARVVDLFDTGVHDHLHAHQARLVGAVDGGIGHGYTVVGGLDDGVLLRVERTLAALATVHDPDQAPHVLAVSHPRRAAVVARRQNTFVADYHGSDGEPRACRTGRDLVGNAHEVLVPGGTDFLQCLVGVRGIYSRVLKGFHIACLPRRR